MGRRERYYYLDWIKIGVIFLLIPFHTAITFTTHGVVPIKYSQHIPILDILTWFLHIWIMPVLFLISGMSSYYSLENRTSKEFIKERYKKLLIPFLAGLFLICPVLSYFNALFSGSFHGSFFRFFPDFFSKPYPQGYFSWWHFWFLIYLFVFTIILKPIFVRINNGNVKIKIISASAIFEKGFLIYLLALPLMITEMILRPLFPGIQNLIWDWANFIFYLVLIFYGFVLAINIRIVDNIQRIRKFSLFLGLILFATALWATSNAKGILGRFSYVFNTFMVFAWIFTIIGYAKTFLNKNNRFYSYLNSASFPFYDFHLLSVSILAYFIVGMKMNIWYKYLIIAVFAYPVTFAIYEMMKKIPGLRFLFGIKTSKNLIR